MKDYDPIFDSIVENKRRAEILKRISEVFEDSIERGWLNQYNVKKLTDSIRNLACKEDMIPVFDHALKATRSRIALIEAENLKNAKKIKDL